MEAFLLEPGAAEPTPYLVPDDEEWMATLAEQNRSVIYFEKEA